MLEVTLEGTEYWDEVNEIFVKVPGATLLLEHSLVSLSKWESKWEKPFTTSEEKTDEEARDYVRCMLIAPVDSLDVLNDISPAVQSVIDAYINAKMTATWFSETKQKPGPKEIITAELIYHWMIALQIPPQYEYWHLNRLLTLIKVVNAKNAPPEKHKPVTKDALAERRALNEKRKAEAQSSG